MLRLPISEDLEKKLNHAKGEQLWSINDNDQLEVLYKPTKNIGGLITPEIIVIHFTAGGDAEGSISWLRNPEAGVSAHLVIDRDGNITQLAPFVTKCYHAGVSKWKGKENLNNCSIGIELANWGKLYKKGNFYYTYTNKLFEDSVHCDENNMYWERITDEQIISTFKICRALSRRYEINDIVGHDEIAPNRKIDPGPTFPIDWFRDYFFGIPVSQPDTTFDITVGAITQQFTAEEYETLKRLFRLFL